MLARFYTSLDENLLLTLQWYFVVVEAMLTPLGHGHTQHTHQKGGGEEVELHTTPCGDLCGCGGRVALRAGL